MGVLQLVFVGVDQAYLVVAVMLPNTLH